MPLRRSRGLADLSVDAGSRRDVARLADVGRLLGLGRLGIGLVAATFPVAAVRSVGLDTATAARVAWLSRMLGARDGALGAGTLAAGRAWRLSPVTGPGYAPWLVAGVASDTVDAVAMVAAVRARRVDRLRGSLGAAVAAAGAIAGLVALWGAVRRGR